MRPDAQRFLLSLEPDLLLRFLRAGLLSDELLLLLDEDESESSDELELLLDESLLLESDDDELDDELFAGFLFLSRSIRLITLEIDSWFSRISLFISLMVSFSLSSRSWSFLGSSVLALSSAFSVSAVGSSPGFSFRFSS